MSSSANPKRTFRSVCVYCGSSNDVAERYLDLARTVGQELAQRGLKLVYGGGNVGLMGVLADAALAAGGQVVGIIPEKLKDLELAHLGVQELLVVPDMHARKAEMMAQADAFITLPGGWGTLEELFEAVTWLQLRYHSKPVGLLNAFGYFDHLIRFVEHASQEGFIRPQHRPLLQSAPNVRTLLTQLQHLALPELNAATFKRR